MYNFIRIINIILVELSINQTFPCSHAVWSLALYGNLVKSC